ncbi:MAG: type IV toxin-antitoxin system AbiEi family antitoxin domain-containing protein [Actinomycetota bacterium]|nr:type IV toxin-antitoxin system AbiEi family antitoxin domain-containing protein [Actinomycetota bacterium]
MSIDHAVNTLAAQQGGVIRKDQAIACGFTRGQIDQRVRDGRWRSLGRSAYSVLEMPGVMNLVRAAVAALPDAVVSHDAAAEIHGLPKLRRGVASVLVHSRTTHVFPDVTVRRCHDLEPSHVVEVDGLPVTSIPRTIVDLSPFLTSRHLRAVLESTVADQRVRVDDVRTVVDEIARRGKPGIRKIRWILDERDVGPRNGTPLERVGATVLREGGIVEPRFEFPIPWDHERRFDVAFPPERLAIEWDSRRWHELVEAFSRDRERDRQALLHGWRVVRFTWVDVTRHPEDVVDTVRRLLEARDAGLLDHSAG